MTNQTKQLCYSCLPEAILLLYGRKTFLFCLCFYNVWMLERAVIDKSLDLKKFSWRNYSYFSLSSWIIVFSFLFLFSIFKILRQKFSFSSRFVRFLKQFSFSSRFSRLWRKNSLSTLDLRDSVHCFSFSSCEKCFIF